MAIVKPLYASIADGEYDVQPGPGGKGTIRLAYSKGLHKDGVEIFVMSNEVAYSAQVLAGTITDVVPTDLSEIRLPYPKVAFEFSISPDMAALRTKQRAKAFGPNSDDGTFDIETVGVYAQEVDDGGVLLQPYWKYKVSKQVEVSPVAILTNVASGFKYPVRPIAMQHPSYPDFLTSLWVTISPAWVAGLSEAELEHLAKVMSDGGTLRTMIQEAVEELPTALFAALMLINCKSGVTVARIPARVAPSGYGKRLKRKYSSPAFTVLALSEVESVSPTGVVSRRPDLAAHYVRGHFKARKSGVYWWNSFIRGSGTPRTRKAYVVKE
jgi:hypothetical protein